MRPAVKGRFPLEFPMSGSTPRYSILRKQGYRVLVVERHLVFFMNQTTGMQELSKLHVGGFLVESEDYFSKGLSREVCKLFNYFVTIHSQCH